MKALLTLLLLIPSLSWGELNRLGKTDITISEALDEGFEIISTNNANSPSSNFVHLYNKKQKKYLLCVVGIRDAEMVEVCGISKWKGYIPEGLTRVD